MELTNDVMAKRETQHHRDLIREKREAEQCPE